MELGRKKYENKGKLGLVDGIENIALDKLVRKKVAGRFGGRLKAFVSGGAALNEEIGKFFIALGIRLLQGYGQTEASPVISANRCFNVKIHTVGPPLIDVNVKIADDGEILVSRRASDERLLAGARPDCQNHRQRLASHRRHRRDRWGRLHPDHRP